jgi:ABC-type amino acid transport system permease subunit
MDKLTQLISDIIKLWQNYGLIYLNGMWKTFSLALICTVVGCLIGFCAESCRRFRTQRPIMLSSAGFSGSFARSSASMSRCFAERP